MSAKKIRDHYFAAWVISTKGRQYRIVEDYILINISKDEYIQFLGEYDNIKPLLKQIRSLVKEFNNH